MRYSVIAAACLALVTQISSQSPGFEDTLLRAVDLAVGESEEVVFSDGKRARVKLLDLQETRDQVCGAVRRAQVKVEINGQPATLVSATYHLPVTVAGVQIDCPITKGYNRDSRTDAWGLMKDARLRLWPAGSSWMPPGAFRYPVKTAMVCQHDSDGERAGLRRWGRATRDRGRSTITMASTSAEARGWSRL